MSERALRRPFGRNILGESGQEVVSCRFYPFPLETSFLHLNVPDAAITRPIILVRGGFSRE